MANWFSLFRSRKRLDALAKNNIGKSQIPWRLENFKDLVWDLEHIGSAVPSEVYRALISQSGTAAPTAIILENNLGDIVWSRDGEGSYKGTLAGRFLPTKTFLMVQNDGNACEVKYIGREDSDMIYLQAFSVDATRAQGDVTMIPHDDAFSNVSIEIRVYS